MKEIGNKISICRQNKNMTQEDLAKRLGVTSQAVSKWERGLSFPDVASVKELCTVLAVSADYLLNVEMASENETKRENVNNEIQYNLKNSLDPLELIFGAELVPVFVAGNFKEEIYNLRVRLSKEGIILPVVRIRDDINLRPMEFMVINYGTILYAEEVKESVDLKYIICQMEDTIRSQYAEILTPDIMKLLIDNIRDRYPALTEEIVPEKISYAKLTKVTKAFLNRGSSIAYLPKILEYMQYTLLENAMASTDDLLGAVIVGVEGKNNFRAKP